MKTILKFLFQQCVADLEKPTKYCAVVKNFYPMFCVLSIEGLE